MNLTPKFIRTSIQNKVFGSFLILLLLVVILASTSFLGIGRLGKASERILKMNYNSIIASIHMMDDIETIHRGYLADAVAKDGDSGRQMYRAQNSFSQWLGRTKDNITELGEKEIVVTIDSLYSTYLEEIQDSTIGAVKEPESQAMAETYRRQIRNNCMRLLNLNQEAMIEKSRTAQKIAEQGKATLMAVASLMLVLGIGFSWGLSRRIVRPIVKLKQATQRIASGDYSQVLTIDSDDELGILTRDFGEMTRKISGFNELNIRKIIQEQQKIEAIFANIDDGILFIGSDFIIRDINSLALHALKLERSEAVGHHFLEVIKLDKLFTDLKKCLETRETLQYTDQQNILPIDKGGVQYYYEYLFSPVMIDERELLGILLLLRDVTRLKELDRLKSEFVMIVSHELKTPLTSINMSIDLLRESLGKDPRKEDLELISIAKEETNRLRMLVNDLLDLSRIESGKIDMHFASTDPRAILDSVVQYFGGQAGERNIEIESQCTEGLGKIWCDEERLMLVFSNLVTNAINAIGQNGRIIMNAEAYGSFVAFSVRDNGPGIPLAYQNRIFDRFVQVQTANTAKGTGLGLTISRDIVRAHGGSIWVESNPGEGAAFYFTIPVEPAPMEQLKEKEL
jgi:NtrC-family two-component system sensor histidine kinase KinB